MGASWAHSFSLFFCSAYRLSLIDEARSSIRFRSIRTRTRNHFNKQRYKENTFVLSQKAEVGYVQRDESHIKLFHSF